MPIPFPPQPTATASSIVAGVEMSYDVIEGTIIVAGVEMSYDAIEGTIIDALLDALPAGYDSPKFAKLTRLLIAIRAQRDMKANTFGSPLGPNNVQYPPGHGDLINHITSREG